MLKTAHAMVSHSSGSFRPEVQLPIDPARVLDRQVISGEVAAGLVVAPGRNLHIGLPSPARPTRGAEISPAVTPLAVMCGFCPVRLSACRSAAGCCLAPRYRLYPNFCSSSTRAFTCDSVSTPLGGKPSITPKMPRPCSVSATITSTGFAVAQ